MSRLDSSSSVSRGAGRFDDGIVWASTAAHSAVRPTLSFRLTSMPRSISAPATSKWPFISARTSALCRSGSTSSMFALPSTSAAMHATQPSRAASSSAVSPPGGSHLSRGSCVRCRSHSTTVDRVLGFAPASISIAIIGAWPCAGGPHQRRLSAPALARLERRPAGDEHLGGGHVAAARAACGAPFHRAVRWRWRARRRRAAASRAARCRSRTPAEWPSRRSGSAPWRRRPQPAAGPPAPRCCCARPTAAASCRPRPRTLGLALAAQQRVGGHRLVGLARARTSRRSGAGASVLARKLPSERCDSPDGRELPIHQLPTSPT